MNTWHEDYWRGGNPTLERANFALMTIPEPLEQALMTSDPDDDGGRWEGDFYVQKKPRSARWLVFWFMVSCSMWAGIGWVLGRMW